MNKPPYMKHEHLINTIEQYKIMRYLAEHFQMESINVEMLDRYSVKVTDREEKSMVFKMKNDKITWKDV